MYIYKKERERKKIELGREECREVANGGREKEEERERGKKEEERRGENSRDQAEPTRAFDIRVGVSVRAESCG